MTFLDTHSVIWAYNAEWERFTPGGLDRIRNEQLAISPAVLLELEFLHEIGRLNKAGLRIIQALARDLGLRVCERPFPDVALAASWLKWTRDPFDRLICGHALAAGGDLLTKDATLLARFPRAVW